MILWNLSGIVLQQKNSIRITGQVRNHKWKVFQKLVNDSFRMMTQRPVWYLCETTCMCRLRAPTKPLGLPNVRRIIIPLSVQFFVSVVTIQDYFRPRVCRSFDFPFLYFRVECTFSIWWIDIWREHHCSLGACFKWLQLPGSTVSNFDFPVFYCPANTQAMILHVLVGIEVDFCRISHVNFIFRLCILCNWQRFAPTSRISGGT